MAISLHQSWRNFISEASRHVFNRHPQVIFAAKTLTKCLHQKDAGFLMASPRIPGQANNYHVARHQSQKHQVPDCQLIAMAICKMINSLNCLFAKILNQLSIKYLAILVLLK